MYNVKAFRAGGKERRFKLLSEIQEGRRTLVGGMGASYSFLFVCLLSLVLFQMPVFALKKPYVVYFGGHSHGVEASSVDYERVVESHDSFLGSYLGSTLKAQEAIIYSYTKYINGFAASLEEEEVNDIRQNPEVISVFPSKTRRLHTTRTWAFMNLERDGKTPAKSIWSNARFGEDTIIANLDSGVWPESESFKDDRMGPIPSRWKGICENDATGAHCNRKLIGIRAYSKGFEANERPLNASERVPRDTDGHGSHTLSTAGGAFVANASIFSFANGTAKGGSPRARVASYKVCWAEAPSGKVSCDDADILAAFDQAIHDGVDVISVSLGGDPADYFQDGIAIGSFHAVQHGIVVVCSAGNDGPNPGSVTNIAPWIITVGASTLDRSFHSVVKLGNGKHLQGQSVFSGNLHQKYYPLINSIDAKLDSANVTAAQLCFIGALDPKKVKGKVVACLRGLNARTDKGLAVHLAGAAGMILANDETSGNDLIADAHFLPSAHITYTDGLALYAYINSTKSPVAYIAPLGPSFGLKPSPFMAVFSSQGPNTVTPEILKPDVTAPGVAILAAYSEAVGPTENPLDNRRVAFNILSGTSMSCPHVSGVVGLLKSLHPDWSPSAIRSAIMTTARSRDNAMEPIRNSTLLKATPFSYGAGHIRPNRAQDPGLVYDLSTNDYLKFLCNIGYNSSQMAAFYKGYQCPQRSSNLDLNYPSITVPNLDKSTTVTRTLKNVGSPGKYKVRLKHPEGVSVSVKPESLTFEKIGEEKSYKITLAPKHERMGGDYVYGRIIWSDGVHYVRSPIVVS
ncbi:subtilisin-like protease SBT5.3 [Aristolochia californica]|uniref:subtilisin-like protease SBT5.3 n=1 Tax=Aristolochia californica TaxID=171875 RepID=UPI0035D717F7